MARSGEEDLKQDDRVRERQEPQEKQIRPEDVATQDERAKAYREMAKGPSSEQGAVLTKPIDGKNPPEMYKKTPMEASKP